MAQWSNLVLSCERCNGKKSNRFPLQATGVRIFTPEFEADGHCTASYKNIRSAVYAAETATLLNPEFDLVESHFVFQPDGEMRSLTARGTETIDILKLNCHALRIARKKILDEMVNEIETCVDNYLASGHTSHLTISLMQVFDKLSRLPDRRKPYSRFAWFMFTKFDLFFANRFGPKQAQIVTDAFTAFRLREV